MEPWGKIINKYKFEFDLNKIAVYEVYKKRNYQIDMEKQEKEMMLGWWYYKILSVIDVVPSVWFKPRE